MLFIFRNHRFSHPRQAFLLVSLLLCLLLAAGCSGSYREDPRLRRAEEVLADPELPQERAVEMLDTLRAIPERGLSEGERHYRSFLMIKASDKGYISHTSDSLYLTVKDYFSSRYREVLPEVLYYGGRIYSDMGVYPVALEHFEGALDRLGDNPSELRLKRCVLSQTGRLLSQLRVHDQALRYVEECLEIGETLDDTLIQVYNLELAGDISDRLKDYKKARGYFIRACDLSKGKYPSEYAINMFRIGYVSLSCGDTTAALNIMRSTISDVSEMDRNFVMPVAARAYLSVGSLDTAYMYAHALIHSPDSLNKKYGYEILLSDPLRGRLTHDTVAEYLCRYDDILEKFVDENMETAALIQNSMYNYSVHDRARQSAEQSYDELKIWLLATGVVALGLGLAFALYYLKKERSKIRFFKIISGIWNLRNEESSKKLEMNNDSHNSNENGEKLMKELMCIYEKSIGEGKNPIPDSILKSPTYLRLIDCIKNEKGIENNKELWQDIESMVREAFPDFMERLRLLSAGKLSVQEEQTALLIKCGFRLKDIADLLGKTQSTIGSRRTSIAKKMFGEKREVKMIDKFIRLM